MIFSTTTSYRVTLQPEKLNGMEKEWFSEWFDSPYYHMLYKSRDESEARKTIDHLLQALNLKDGATILDLACGKGRHARYLAEKGFVVTGLDISEASIAFAREFEHARLEFFQHDMRKPFRSNYFDGVMNMFTSFGYFNTEHEHLLTLKNVTKELKPGGLFLLDYFNSLWVRKNLIAQDTKTVDGVTFHLNRKISKGNVFKTVEFRAAGRQLIFTESVRLFEYADFDRLLTLAGMKINKCFGDYDLSPFVPEQSSRLILVAQKIT
ncbi:MAG: methyltransferase domain-containing protein [Saprospiraceae bacterium]|nr:methyltransferase domain-containing protein [Saprospiraceae bacterium]